MRIDTLAASPREFFGLCTKKFSKAPWDTCLGLPYHSHLEADYQPLTPGEPAELVFDPAPLVTKYRGADYLLFIELPVNRGVEPGCRKQ